MNSARLGVAICDLKHRLQVRPMGSIMTSWSWKGAEKVLFYLIVLATILDIGNTLHSIDRELSNIEDNTARTFKILMQRNN